MVRRSAPKTVSKNEISLPFGRLIRWMYQEYKKQLGTLQPVSLRGYLIGLLAFSNEGVLTNEVDISVSDSSKEIP